MATPLFILELPQITIFVIDILGCFLGIWVLSSSPKSKINRYFSLMVVSYVAWISFYYIMRLQTQTETAFVWAKLGFAGVFIFIMFLYFFSLHFLNKIKDFPVLNKAVTIAGLSLVFLSLFTNFVASRMETTEWGMNPILPNVGKFIFFGFVFLICIFILILFSKKYYKTSEPQERLKIQYVLLGFFFLIVINFIFNIFFPLWLDDFRYSYFGNYSFIFLIGFTAYAIVKRELFGMRVVLTQILVGVIAILLLVNILISESLFEYIWKIVLFILFVIFGYFLIRSVIQEIKRRVELQRLYAQVDKLSKSKSEFISIASHQLRTPLAVVKGYISMIIEGTYGKLSPKLSRPMENVYESNERLIGLVSDLLNLSRLEAGRIELNLESASLEQIIQSVISELGINAEKKGLSLQFKKISPLPKMRMDADKMRQVVLNIVDNAIKYTQEGGIIVELKRTGQTAQIKVSDTGQGMTKKEMQDIFEMFTRARTGHRHFIQGAGIGLYIARKFVEMHKGRIWAESEGKNKGSTFFIELPIGQRR